jgi:hypothetical protein
MTDANRLTYYLGVSDGGTHNIDSTANLNLGQDYRLNIYGTGVGGTVSFSSEFYGLDGLAMPDVTVTSDHGYAYSFIPARHDGKARAMVLAWTNDPRLAPASDAQRTFEEIEQSAHGFTALQPVLHNGTNWVAAQANNADTVAQAIVTKVVDANNFEVTTHGVATVTGHGLTVGEYYWLDGTSTAVTASQPASGIAQSVLHVRDANTVMIDIGQAMSASEAITEEDVSSIQLTRTTGQSIPQSTVTPVVLDSVAWAVGSDLTVDAVNGRVDVATSGRYMITASGGVDAGASAFERSIVVSVNGSAVIDLAEVSTAFRPTVAKEVQLVAGDYVDLRLFHGDTVRNTEISDIGRPTLTVRRTDAQKTVIPATALPVNDQSASGYFDFRDMRMQWGVHDLTSDSAMDVLFPAPFADTSTSITLGLAGDSENYDIATSGDIDVVIKMINGGLTTTKFSIDRDDDMQNTNNWKVHWHAIGRKP